MKHTIKITVILLAMFFVTQLIGLLVIHAYTPIIQEVEINGTLQNITENPLPYGMETPEETNPASVLSSLLIAFALAILLIFLLMKFGFKTILRLWFFFVVAFVLAITFFAFEILMPFEIDYIAALIVPLVISIPLAYYKIFKRNLIVHNSTELLIYPGIAAVFVSLLAGLSGLWGLWIIIILLILISLYDMWAVWHTGFMQKMAKFQMNELKLFSGFFVPYLTKKQRQKLKKLRKEKTDTKTAKTKSMKVSLAILGGGDVVFPIITAGIILRLWGLAPALSVSIFSTLALLGLFSISKKGKFYPAMPFISGGLFLGIFIGWLMYLVL